MSLLDRDPTPEDLEAEREAPRPGLWAGESGADLRKLTQDETDALIRCELVLHAPADDEDAVARACGMRSASASLPLVLKGGTSALLAHNQRGGIDSDPLVRILARRAWGDRDRAWFELRGVRKGDVLVGVGGDWGRTTRGVTCRVGARWGTREIIDAFGVAAHDASPGEVVAPEPRGARVGPLAAAWDSFTEGLTLVVGDRPRERPSESAFYSTLEEPYADRSVVVVVDDPVPLDNLTPHRRAGHRQQRPPIPPWAREKRGRSGRPGR